SDLRCGLHAEGRDDLENTDDDQPDCCYPNNNLEGPNRSHQADDTADEQDDTEEDVPATSVLVRKALHESGEPLKEEGDTDENSQQPLASL
mgnify:CR=1